MENYTLLPSQFFLIKPETEFQREVKKMMAEITGGNLNELEIKEEPICVPEIKVRLTAQFIEQGKTLVSNASKLNVEVGSVIVGSVSEKVIIFESQLIPALDNIIIWQSRELPFALTDIANYLCDVYSNQRKEADLSKFAFWVCQNDELTLVENQNIFDLEVDLFASTHIFVYTDNWQKKLVKQVGQKIIFGGCHIHFIGDKEGTPSSIDVSNSIRHYNGEWTFCVIYNQKAYPFIYAFPKELAISPEFHRLISSICYQDYQYFVKEIMKFRLEKI